MDDDTRRLDLAEREIHIKERELDLKVQEAGRAAWRSPLVVAVFAAALAALSNAWIAYYNAGVAREDTRLASENARILGMLDADPDQAAQNLDFLLRTGLVTDADLRDNLRRYLATRAPGTGPSLRSRSVADTLAPEVEQGLVEVFSEDDGVMIRLSSSFLFGSGDGEITQPGAPAVLDRIALALNTFVQGLAPGGGDQLRLTVIGHTDSVPIRSLAFPDNAALSLKRARSVAEALMPLLPAGLTVATEGRGETEPITHNATPEGRALNRRVEILIQR